MSESLRDEVMSWVVQAAVEKDCGMRRKCRTDDPDFHTTAAAVIIYYSLVTDVKLIYSTVPGYIQQYLVPGYVSV